MRIAIVGIGGVGGYFGGKLARAYATTGEHDIIFIARGAHLNAIQKNGLQLFTRQGDYVVWPNIATDNPSEIGLFDLVFFCVKSYSLESAARLIRFNLSKNTVIIPLLNGVDGKERLQDELSNADIVSGSVYIISHVAEPGIINQEGGACKLTFGTDDKESSKQYSFILDILLKAKINAHLTDTISVILWTKFLLMCPMASLTSATGMTYGAILEDHELRIKVQNMMREVFAVAKARHIFLPENAVEKTMAMAAGFDYNSKTSMQLDREKGRQTEIDSLTNFLCRAGRESGVPTPLHDEVLKQLMNG